MSEKQVITLAAVGAAGYYSFKLFTDPNRAFTTTTASMVAAGVPMAALFLVRSLKIGS